MAIKRVPSKKKAVIADEDKPDKGVGVFDLINAVSFSKEDLIRNADNPEQAAKVYSPFLTNRGLSFHVSSIFDANEMNQFPGLDAQLQFDYLRQSVRKEKRWGKWTKTIKGSDVKMIRDYYQCSFKRAIEYKSLMNKEQLNLVKEATNTGG